MIAAAVFLKLSLARTVPKVIVPTEDDAEAQDELKGRKKLDPQTASPRDAGPGLIQCDSLSNPPAGQQLARARRIGPTYCACGASPTVRPPQPRIQLTPFRARRCWDPCTMDDLGTVKAFTPAEVAAAIARARQAQAQWRDSTFAQREHLMRVIRRAILDNMETVARVACRDSGKTRSDAILGELMVTMEKCRWLAAHGARYLRPEYRESGTLNMLKTSRVEYAPVGVVGAIVPWNYPCHNVFNPLTASLFAGNGIVIKVRHPRPVRPCV